MKEITLETTIAQLLNNYEGMKEKLIEINPKFKKLNNPILRRTVAKLATVKQAAIIGGMKAEDLLNQLREMVGQQPVKSGNMETKEESPAPRWIEQTPAMTLNANEILDNEENPLAKANQALKKFDDGEILEITSDFRPEPLIVEFSKKGYEVAVEKINDKRFLTRIKKV